MKEHKPDGPRGFSLGTTEQEVTIHDRHGCEVVLFIAEARAIARSILLRYSAEWLDRE